MIEASCPHCKYDDHPTWCADCHEWSKFEERETKGMRNDEDKKIENMVMWDVYAAAALKGLVSSDPEALRHNVAQASAYADAMLKARAERFGGRG